MQEDCKMNGSYKYEIRKYAIVALQTYVRY